MALGFLEGQFDEDEAQEVADVAAEAAQTRAALGASPMEVRWAVEEVVLEAFGYHADLGDD